MSDLTDWGVDVEDEAETVDETPAEESDIGWSYPRGRCPAISTGSRKRCRSPVSRMQRAGDFCGVHGREDDPWTIYDGPETLILLTGELDALSLGDLAPEDVDFDLEQIRTAVEAVQEGADE